MRQFDLPAPVPLPDARNHWLLFDSPGEYRDFLAPDTAYGRAVRKRPFLSDWCGDAGPEAAIRSLTEGDASAVPASDAIMAKFEDLEIATARRSWRHDVTGPVADVQAFLAGSPLSMRRRVRTEDTGAPLTLVVDTVCSAGFSAEQMRKRGVAILALARLLTASRPVELWAGSASGVRGHGAKWDKASMRIFVRLETAPLDLLTGAHLLSSLTLSRGIGYTVSQVMAGKEPDGSVPWSYQSREIERAHIAAINAQAFPGEVISLAGAFLKDPILADPVAWVREMLAKHGRPDAAEAA